MTFERLGQENAEAYIAYLRTAMREEPEKMTAETVDEEGIRNRVSDSFYTGTTSILAMEDGNVVGRIEYHFYGCMQDGYRMAYVDWVYVLKAYRHRGIAQMLFAELEKDCGRNGIDQYYLIRARNEEADRFTEASGELRWRTPRFCGNIWRRGSLSTPMHESLSNQPWLPTPVLRCRQGAMPPHRLLPLPCSGADIKR